MVASLTGTTTLAQHAVEQEHRLEDASGALSGLLDAFAAAVTVIAGALGKGALIDPAERLSVLGDEVMTASDATLHPTPRCFRRGEFLLVFDPLDTADDVDTSTGTIFSLLRTREAAVEPGAEQVGAGFALYGPATMLVLTTGDGVDGFTLDRDTGAFLLTHPRIRVPATTNELGLDAADRRFWEPPVKRYVAECLAGTTGPRGRDFTVRWDASLVTAAYRVLTHGGVVLYPRDTRTTGEAGQPLPTSECRPVAFLVEQAGGLASTGRSRVLDLPPSGLHQRAPIVFGSREEVERIELYHREPAGAVGADFSLFNVRSLFKV